VRVSNVVSLARLAREWIKAGGPSRRSKEGRGRQASTQDGGMSLRKSEVSDIMAG